MLTTTVARASSTRGTAPSTYTIGSSPGRSERSRSPDLEPPGKQLTSTLYVTTLVLGLLGGWQLATLWAAVLLVVAFVALRRRRR